MTKKHIYVYSPSGAVRDRAAFRRGIRYLQKLGHEVEVDPDALTSCMRFAGDDAVRVAAIHRAAASGADVALISRGGYGLTRILDAIDYAQVAKAIENGTQFVGLSDFTALQLALLKAKKSITWAGPALCEGFGVSQPTLPDEVMLGCFTDLLESRGEGVGWRQLRDITSIAQESELLQEKIISNAVLWGGNLSLLGSLVGTRFFPQIRGGALFLEDVFEHPYRIERMLSQLLYAGVLEQQKVILLGQFTDYKYSSFDKGFKLRTVVEWLRSKTKVPILTNLPYGHVATKVLLPVGAKVDIVVRSRDVLMAWGHLVA